MFSCQYLSLALRTRRQLCCVVQTCSCLGQLFGFAVSVGHCSYLHLILCTSLSHFLRMPAVDFTVRLSVNTSSHHLLPLLFHLSLYHLICQKTSGLTLPLLLKSILLLHRLTFLYFVTLLASFCFQFLFNSRRASLFVSSHVHFPLIPFFQF